MRLLWRLVIALILGAFINTRYHTKALEIPLKIEQPPTITEHSPATIIALSFDEYFEVKCEAKGNPDPEFKWTKNGQEFDPYQDPMLINTEDSGTFVIPNSGNLTEYQGTYRCFAYNVFGTAMSEEIEFIIPNVPKFPKEKIEAIKVEEGQAFILECNPPKGIPPLEIYWMTISMKQIEQDERVTVGLNGNLYFSNAIQTDSRRDYCCFASFPRIRTIVQKTAMSVIVSSSKSLSQSGSRWRAANAIRERKPSFLSPSGGQTYTHIVKGEEMLLECIAEGFPTPVVEWIKIGDTIPDRAVLTNFGKHLTIEGITEDDEGKYMCKAYNAHGAAVHYFDVVIDEPPKWNIKPESQLNVIGSDVAIRCAAYGNPVPTVSWMVNGRPLSEVPKPNRKVYDDTIMIHNASPSDSAVYQCEASNRHGTLLANANIMIMNLAPVILTEDNLQYLAVVGKQVIMHCRAFSSPPPAIIWSKDDSVNALEGERFSIHANGSLEIHSVKDEDDGEYTCVTKNSEGKLAITAILQVTAPTKIVDSPVSQRVLIGTPVQFSCQADIDPSFNQDYQIIWEKDGLPLNNSEITGYFVDGGMLQIVNVSFRDQGVYTCVVRTPVDIVKAPAVLTVLGVPDAPQGLVLAERRNRTVKLKWVPGDDHNSTTTEFIIEYEESQWEPGRWKELVRVPGNHHSTLLKLHGHTDYSFRVSAVNGVGKGQPSRATDRYKTPASAPDKNPGNIKIEANFPHEMDINWKPLPPIEHNGPGLEYKVSYRQQDVEEEWQEHMVKRHSFVVKNTQTFVSYEIKIQAKNHVGWAPEPETIVAYSGEDFPSAAPENIAVEVMNNTVVKVSWNRVHKDKLHGHLGGYRVQWWHLRSLLNLKKLHSEKHTLMIPGDRHHALIQGLKPFSEYSLIVMVYNGRGNGPGSQPVTFKTPEGVPDQAVLFRATDIQKHALTLSWSPPVEVNGVLTGCVLQYQLINKTEESGPLITVNITNPNTNKWHLRDLEPISRYRFYLYFCTQTGCGPAASQEYITTPEARLASIHSGISNQGWFIGLMSAVALLTLIVLVICFVNRNKGGKYSVKEKEDLHPDLESQGINDDTFCEYSDNDEKPLKGSQYSLSGDLKQEDSADSIVDYGNEDAQFNEDGSFIGEYAGKKERASMEIKGTS